MRLKFDPSRPYHLIIPTVANFFKNQQLFTVVVKWFISSISLFLNPGEESIYIDFSTRLTTKTIKMIATRGPIGTITYLKKVRVILFRYLAGDPLFVFGIAQYHDSLPKVLGPQLANLIRSGNMWAVRITLSILQISRVIQGWNKPDLSPIYLPPRKEFIKLQEDFKAFLVANKHLYRHFQPRKWDNLHVTTRMGPNGPALLNATFDFPKWRDRFLPLVGMFPSLFEKLLVYLSTQAPFFPYFISKPKKEFENNPILRRISTVDDKEGKERVIGIGDYWSQSVLKPFHESILALLGGWKTDLTSGQNIAPFGDDSQLYHSIDLTSATDRFPLSLQVEVVAVLMGDQYSKMWRELMVGEPFWFKGKFYYYRTGQPMGLYSSWAVFALTHHLWIQFSAKRVGKQLPFLDYRVLGDDVVIRDDVVAKEYLNLLDQIGVDVSKDKTLVSPHTFEFAKRLFYKGTEVTGFPIAGIVSTSKGVTELLMVLSESLRRGYPDLFNINHNIIADLYRSLRKSKVKGFITFDNDFIERLNIKAIAFWCYLTRFSSIPLLNHAIECKLGYNPFKDYDEDRLLSTVKEYLARGVIQNQTELIFRDQGLMEEISVPLKETLKEYHILMMPTMMVLQEEYFKIVTNVSILEENLMSCDWDEILFRSFIELDVNPTQIMGTERRVQAKKAQAKAISLGFKYMKEENPPIS